MAIRARRMPKTVHSPEQMAFRQLMVEARNKAGLTQQELADLVGATRPVVSTILNRLRKQGVLGYTREYVCVRAIETIEQLIGE